MAQDLYYSEDDKMFFNVYGYTAHHCYPIEFSKLLIEEAQKIVDITGCDIKDVRFYEVLKSRRYKHNLVFYVKSDKCPEYDGIMTLGGSWNMIKWLEF